MPSRSGLAEVGIEWGRHECATRAAAGLATIRASVSDYPPELFAGIEGLWASPPCPDFSIAGKRAGRAGSSGWLTEEVPRWVEVVRPRWVACEQVPDVLPLWRAHARRYESMGYGTFVGIVDPVNLGLPQTRRRAILMAHRDRIPEPPESSHAETVLPMMDTRKPWVTLRDALPDVPDGWTLHHWRGSGIVERYGERIGRTLDQPCFAVRAWKDSRMRWHDENGEVVGPFTSEQMMAVQGFPADWPFAGSNTRRDVQIGNAVPPPLAAAILGRLM